MTIMTMAMNMVFRWSAMGNYNLNYHWQKKTISSKGTICIKYSYPYPHPVFALYAENVSLLLRMTLTKISTNWDLYTLSWHLFDTQHSTGGVFLPWIKKSSVLGRNMDRPILDSTYPGQDLSWTDKTKQDIFEKRENLKKNLIRHSHR